jgi:type II secretory pathway component HofQ
MITSLRPVLLAFLCCAAMATVGVYAQEEGSSVADEFFPLPDAVVGQDLVGQTRKLPSVNPSGRLDVLQLKDMDINDVLNLLSSRTGLNIVAGKGVQGRVTMFLKDVDARAVLALILKSNGFAYEEHSGIIEVMSAEEYERRHGAAFGIDMQTELFNLDYIGADTAAKALGSILTKDTGTIQLDDASGS